MNNVKLRRMTTAALCGAVGFVLMFISFSIPVISPFAEFDLSALPDLIGGFILGPAGAVMIVTVKIVLKLLFKGTTSMFTGELQSFILSLAYVLPAVLYYRSHKTRKGAAVSLVIGSLVSIVVSIFTNVYLIFPAFMTLYGMDWDSIVAMCTAVAPWIKDVPSMVAFSIVPFNIISRVVTSLITMVVYKNISVPIKNLIYEDNRRTYHELQCK